MLLSRAARTMVLFSAALLPAFAADPALVRMIPADATVIAGIDVTRSMASPFGQFVLTKVQNEDESFRDFVNATGFDPRRDLRELVVVSNQTLPGPKKGNGLVLARGNFDVARIGAHIRTVGGQLTQYAGADVLESKDGHGLIALLDASTALAGEAALVRAALDRRSAASGLSPTVSAKLNDLSARYDAWMYSTQPLSRFAPRVDNPQVSGTMKSNALQGIEQVSGGVKFGQTVQIDGEALMRSDKDATALADVLRFLAGMVQMQGDQNPEAARFGEFLKGLEFKTEGNSVRLSMAVPEADLEKFFLENAKPRTPKKKSAA